MPELPEIAAIVHFLREHAVGRTVTRVDIVSLAALKTASPPWTELHGREVRDVERHGKFLDLDCGGLHLVVHLARAGWLRWADTLPAAPPRPGRSPLAVRVHLGPPGSDPGFDLTEAGTRKGLAVWVVHSPAEVPPIAQLGPDAPGLDRAQLGELLSGRTERLKTVLTTQSVLSGLGNAYSDEVLHVARLSPFATAGRLTEIEIDRLHEAIQTVLADAVHRSIGLEVARLKGEKRSGLRVHGRTGLPCPVCADTIREVSFSDRAFQYCPTCQTNGKLLADRRRSKFIK
ncbi:Fpg/Nei family DNA glycosylase [Actinoalloteichus hymeniacidonis]|uniref:Fpg/Nei family DNA glycosylase n=1 Tax=Actinoalloteichus hymeniacidonis TaxID=340345 RepID=UPI0008528D9C|nr:DNA-formamidopyrimidine glycosylase family protein [Actinoalloteichus hymeniacidonis]MBB5911081.1 formamidopyrimidine-DNA glycosylase [Actinoalloteichus hymeniacidonis]